MLNPKNNLNKKTNLEKENFTEKKLDVKYLSQYLELEKTLEGVRACGITCMKMILDYLNIKNSSLKDLYKKGLKEGGFGPSGWYHDYFLKILKENGLENSFRKEKMLDEDLNLFLESIDTNLPVIASTEIKLFDKKFFHMVILTGYKKDKDGKILGFYYNDPAKTDNVSGKDIFVETAIFKEYWRRMAIFPKR